VRNNPSHRTIQAVRDNPLTLANNISGHIRDEQHNIEVDGRMYSKETEIADLVGEHLQTKEKTRMRGEG
jgi:hypothetical protein